MAGDTKDARSERDAQSLVADLLRRVTSPEVLAGVAGAAAAARFTRHLVEDPDEPEAEEPEVEESLRSDETHDASEDESSAEEDEEGDDEDEGEREELSAEEDEGEADEGERQEPDGDQSDDESRGDEKRDEPVAEDEQGPQEADGDTPSAEEEEEAEAAADPGADEGDETEPEQDAGAEDREETSDSSANGSVTDDERMELLDQARRYAEQLTGHPVESFSSLERDDRGWRIGLEVVELSRVPSTTDVLGSYELVLSDEGEFVDFRRGHRYSRNSTDVS
jgi:Gas vesicle synthesis protein GvpO